MVIDHSYKISAFGDFSDIKPNAETMMYFFEKVKDYGLLPSVFQELQIKVDGAQPVTQQRIALLSSDSREKVSIPSVVVDNPSDTFPSSKNSADSTDNGRAVIPVEVEAMTVLSSMLESEDFETGISNLSEKYFRKLLDKNTIACPTAFLTKQNGNLLK